MAVAPHPTELTFAHLWEVGEQLRTCLCDALEQYGYQTPVCACVMMPGAEVIADWCSSSGKTGTADGQAWVRLLRLYNSVRFPLEATDAVNAACNMAGLAAEFELGVMRCATAAAKIPPNPEKVTADARTQWQDAVVLKWVAACCLPSTMKRVVTSYTPLSGGGCNGGRLTIMVQLRPGTPITTTP